MSKTSQRYRGHVAMMHEAHRALSDAILASDTMAIKQAMARRALHREMAVHEAVRCGLPTGAELDTTAHGRSVARAKGMFID